jgi:hypothetical protein
MLTPYELNNCKTEQERQEDTKKTRPRSAQGEGRRGLIRDIALTVGTQKKGRQKRNYNTITPQLDGFWNTSDAAFIGTLNSVFT